MQLIINVDDLGLHPAVTRAVNTLSENKLISSTSVLANGPCFRDALSLQNSVGCGAHLNLLRGYPISNPEHIPTLLNKEGMFFGNYKSLFIHYLKNKLSLEEIEKEWTNQITALKDNGITITHIDSEKHIHCWPGLHNIVLKLAKKFRIKWVRIPIENHAFFPINKGVLRSHILNFFCRNFPENKSLMSPGIVWGIANQGPMLHPEYFENYLQSLKKPYEVIEVVCHPGLKKPEDPEIDQSFGQIRIHKTWQAEFDAFINRKDQWKAVFKKFNLKLTHYGKIQT